MTTKNKQTAQRKNEYFVLHKKDFDGLKLEKNKKKREIYDRRSKFESIKDAREFALENLHEQSILVRANYRGAIKGMPDSKKQYVIAGYFEHKYSGCCFGEIENVPTHEVERCSEEYLEKTIREMAEDKPNKIYWGLEIKLFTGESNDNK